MADTDISELEELGAEKVSGVGNPANGTSWLLLKAQREGDGIERDPNSPHTESPEADAQEEQMTKAEADEIEALLTKSGLMSSYCGDETCEVCKEHFDTLPLHLVQKAKLKMKQRRALPKGAFAIPEKAPGSGSYPIHDISHARNALARASGKPVEARVKAAVHRKWPEIDQGKAEKSPGVPDESVAKPTEHGQLAHGQSGLAGPMTGAPRKDHADPSFTLGGEASLEIPAEAKVKTNPPAPAVHDRPGEGGVVTSKEAWEIEVVEKQNWVSLNGEPAEDSAPGSPAWEAYDASTLDSVARGLADSKRAVMEIRNRELAEAVAGDPNDWFDAFKLDSAAEDICSALGLVATLAYHEAAEGAQKAIRDTRDHLTQLLGEGNQADTAGNGAKPSEEDDIMATITKEELDAHIDERVSAAVKQQTKKATKKLTKAQKKSMKKLPQQIAGAMAKNANNGGDITAESMRGAVHGQHDANDVNAVPDGGHVDGQYVNKQDPQEKKPSKAEKKLIKAAEAIQKSADRLAGRPHAGGPNLTGIPPTGGAFPAAEGRGTEGVTKSEGAMEIERLEKSFAEEKDPGIRMQLGEKLTLERLRQAHENNIL